jgi:hypothetical protein
MPMRKRISFRSANALNACIAALLAKPYGFTVLQTCPSDPPGRAVRAGMVVVDLDSLPQAQFDSEQIRAVVLSRLSPFQVAVASRRLSTDARRSLSRRGVMVYSRLDEGVFSDLAWEAERRLRTAA